MHSDSHTLHSRKINLSSVYGSARVITEGNHAMQSILKRILGCKDVIMHTIILIEVTSGHRVLRNPD